jgi:hypothetical protein
VSRTVLLHLMQSTARWKRHTTEHQIPRSSQSNPLNVSIVWDGRDRLREAVLRVDDVGVAGLNGLSLQVQVDALLFGLALLNGVLLDTVDELLAGARVRDVLDADVDALLKVTVADTLVDDDTDGGLGHVVDNTGLAVVDLVGHTANVSVQILPYVITPAAVIISRWRCEAIELRND